MNLETLKKQGIFFSFCREGVFPQIPYVQDVLFVLQLSEVKHVRGNYCAAGAANWPTYISNLLLVAAAVSSHVLLTEGMDERRVRRYIAEAIMDMCPGPAKCLFNDAFVSAQEEFVGVPAPSRTASRDVLLRACECKDCKRVLALETHEPSVSC